MTKHDDNSEDFLSLSDFESFKTGFAIQNTTTNTVFRNPASIRMVELQEQGMTLEVPARSCSKGHKLLLEVEVIVPKKDDFGFSATASVEAIESIDKDEDRIVITLLQFDDDEWVKFQGLFSSRQEEIQNFLKAARGF